MNYKKIFFGMTCIAALSGAFGCSKQTNDENIVQKHVTEIPMILTVDPTTGKKNEEDMIRAFNEKYEGIYHMDVQWVLQTEEEYRTNLKRLNVTDELPAIITDLRLLPSFYQLLVKENRIEDLSPYINSDSEWKEMIEPTVLQACTEADGSIYLSPLSTAVFSCSGVFWNEQLFQQAGIERFPDTWEEFWNCCDILQRSGITPLALHTEGTAWAPMLLATAELADNQEGAEFMERLYPDSYQNQSGLHLASTLKKLFLYTTGDAIYADFDVSYRNFVSGKAAMVPNGYWMLDQIPKDIEQNVRFAPFPGNKLVSSPETFGWAVVSSYSEEVKKGAIEFLKFRTAFNQKQKKDFLEGTREGNSQMLIDYIDAYTGNPQIVPNYQVKWNSGFQEETLGECIPKLVKDQMTEEDFVRRADESVKRFQEER